MRPQIQFLKRCITGGSAVYTLTAGRARRGVMLLVARADMGTPCILDITPAVAALIGRTVHKDGFIYLRGTGFDPATDIITDMNVRLFPETPFMENIRHRRL